MKYAYIIVKRSGKVHELDENDRTYCQIENSSKRLTQTDHFPAGRHECWCCKSVKAERLYNATHGRMDREFKAIMQ